MKETVYSIHNRPAFEVIIWIRLTPAHEKIERRLYFAADEEPYESVALVDARDYHWGFGSHKNAMALVDRLRDISEEPDVIVFRLSCRDEWQDSVTFKDTRKRRS